ncbi:MAG TPA: TatD family hydrolase [Acidobacteriaceae bacterium]|nr:TatD family hydrolase [Acidobacteriaceae bacterium]
MLVDSHAHLDSDRYAEDREAMLVRAYQAGVETILAVGIGEGPDTMHAALDLSRQYRSRQDMPQIVVSAGIHPHEANLADESALEKLDALAAEPEVVAVGEIGLDYFYDHSPREVQQRAFVDQMIIAAARKLPILIHCRASADSKNAWDDALALLDEHWRATGLGGVLHCFGGEDGHAKKAMDMNFLVSFAGNITFPKAQPIRDVAAKLPAERILIETDAPFLAPVPHRGKRNEPAMVERVAQQLAEVRGSDYETMALTTRENFYRFFRLSRTARVPGGDTGTGNEICVEN